MDTLFLGDEYVVVHLKSCYNSLNWALIYDADVYFHLRVLIRFLELISVPNQFRDSFNLFRLDTLYLGDDYVGIFGNQCYNLRNWRYLYDADVFFQFWGQIRILELISFPNQSRVSFNLFRMDTLSLGYESFVVPLKSCYNSLNWALLYEADVFFHFRDLVRFLELICVPHQSRESFNLFRMDTLSLGDECVVVHLKSCYNSLNWALLYDADVFFHFRVLIRFLKLICVPNQFRDSFNVFRLDTLYLGDEYVGIFGKQCYNSLNWRYFYDADVLIQFWVLIRFLELISVTNQSRDSFNSFRLDTLSLGDEYVGIFGNQCHNSPNWTYPYDADVFFQFRVLIRFLELICVPDQSRDTFKILRLDTLYLGDEYVGIFGKWCNNSRVWRYLYDADVFYQFWGQIRILELISFPNQSRVSFNFSRMDTLSLGYELFVVHLKSCYSSLNWALLYEAYVFFFIFGICFGFQSSFASRISPEFH